MSLSVFAISLGLTLLFEVPFAWAWGLRSRYNIIVAVLVNLLTNPAVVLLKALGIPILLLEGVAIAVEAACYGLCGEEIHRPVLLSVYANVFSYSMGLILNAVC